MTPCIFLDRDGILNQVIMRDGLPASPRSVEEFKFLPSAIKLLSTIKSKGYLAIIVTNQPDIGRGLMSQKTLDIINSELMRTGKIDQIFCACSGDQNDSYRKPNNSMIVEASKIWDVDLSSSLIIGDSWKDIEAGKRAGIKTLLLETTYNTKAHGTADKNFYCYEAIIEYIKSL